MDNSYLEIIETLQQVIRDKEEVTRDKEEVIRDQEEVIRHHEATIQSLEIKVETLKSKLLEESSNFHHTILVRKISYNYCVIITFLFIFLLYYSF